MPGREGRRRLGRREILVFLAVLGPGIITAMVDNDAGGIATYSVAGARFGYELLWVLTFTAILLALVQEMTVRMGMVTGKGLAALIRERFSIRLTSFIMLILLITNFANTISNFAGLAAGMQLFHVPPYLAVPPLAALVWWLVVKGTYKSVEKVFLIASMVYISYIISAVLAGPNWGEVGKALVTPSPRFDASYLALTVTIVGTTIAPWMQFYQQASIVDKGLDASKLGYERLDTAVGSVLMTMVAMFIVICCGAAFFNNPQVGATTITSAEQAAKALAPIAGNNASYLFAFGLLVASLFAGSILPLSTAYTVCEAFGWESGVDRSREEAPQFYFIYTFFIIGSAVLVMIPGIPLVLLMVVSQTMNGILLPVILFCMLTLVNDRDIMGEFVNPPWLNTIMWAVTGLLTVLTLAMIVSTFFPAG
ncbi:Nramp family divalent metal transporter [Candidatus Solincola tengchongensis]|uniref:Nramp family divalent metal transporter n=1 Tax=Candidatus Solincola tengchongensis TaxID=2900693 RepID=UPI00257DB81E|nr:Nramp family divalent metal transporter [Candidatus Solincola tengchongensis]